MAENCATCDYSYIGKGKVYLGALTNGVLSGGLFPVGNVSELTISPSVNERRLLNYMDASGGNCATSTKIESVNLSMTAWNFCPRNLALLSGGTHTDSTGAAITGETHVAYLGGLLSFNEMYDKTVAPVISAGGTPLVADTDYELTETGAIIKNGIADGDTVTVSYTSVDSFSIQSLTDLGKEFMVVFEGLNEATSGKRAKVTAFRFKPTPGESIPWISDDFASSTLSGELLTSNMAAGVGESKYWKVDIEKIV